MASDIVPRMILTDETSCFRLSQAGRMRLELMNGMRSFTPALLESFRGDAQRAIDLEAEFFNPSLGVPHEGIASEDATGNS